MRMLSRELNVLVELFDFQPDMMDETIVMSEWRDFSSELADLTLSSQRAIDSRVSCRRDWWRMTSQQGRKTVKISMNMMDTQIL